VVSCLRNPTMSRIDPRIARLDYGRNDASESEIAANTGRVSPVSRATEVADFGLRAPEHDGAAARRVASTAERMVVGGCAEEIVLPACQGGK
jgi:hypothetical protein